MFSLVWSWQVFRVIFVKKTYTEVESGIFNLSLVPLLFFSFASLKGDIADPHWANLFYLGMMMLLASRLHELWQQHSQRITSLFLINLAFNILLIGAIYFHLSQPLIEIAQYHLKRTESLTAQGMPDTLAQKLESIEGISFQKHEFVEEVQKLISHDEFVKYQDMLLQVAIDTKADGLTSLLGWQDSAQQIDALITHAGVKQVDYVLSREYQLSSALSFYLQGQPFPHSIEKPARNQWSPKDQVTNSHTVIVCPPRNCQDVLSDVKLLFEKEVQSLGTVIIKNQSRIIRILEVYIWKQI